MHHQNLTTSKTNINFMDVFGTRIIYSIHDPKDILAIKIIYYPTIKSQL